MGEISKKAVAEKESETPVEDPNDEVDNSPETGADGDHVDERPDDDSEQVDDNGTDDQDDDTLGDSGKRALQRERDARKEATERVTELESSVTELTEKVEAADEAVTQAQADKAEAECRYDRLKAVVDAGLPVECVDFINGTDEDSIADQVKKLAAIAPNGNRKFYSDKLGADSGKPSGNPASLLGDMIRDSLSRD